MGPKSKRTAHWADAQSAALSNWVTNAAKCEVSKDYIVEGALNIRVFLLLQEKIYQADINV